MFYLYREIVQGLDCLPGRILDVVKTPLCIERVKHGLCKILAVVRCQCICVQIAADIVIAKFISERRIQIGVAFCRTDYDETVAGSRLLFRCFLVVLLVVVRIAVNQVALSTSISVPAPAWKLSPSSSRTNAKRG